MMDDHFVDIKLSKIHIVWDIPIIKLNVFIWYKYVLITNTEWVRYSQPKQRIIFIKV